MKQLARWIGIWMLAGLMLVAPVAAGAARPDLDISSSQKDQLKALAANTRDRTGRERDSLRQARMELMKAYSSYAIDWHRLNGTWARISSAQLSLLNIHLNNEIALRNILKAEQFKVLRDMMKRRMRDRDMLVIAPPEVEILDRLPDKRMLDALGVPDEKQKQLENEPAGGRAIQELRESSKDLLDLYSNYALESSAARKLIDNLHRKQVSLLRQQNYRQRQIRKVLTQDQFQKLQQEIAKRMAERGQKRWPGERGPRTNRHK